MHKIDIPRPAQFAAQARTGREHPWYRELTVSTPYGPAQYTAYRGVLVVFDPEACTVHGFVTNHGDERWTAYRLDGTQLGTVEAKSAVPSIAWLRLAG